jgi:N-acyl-phosphatidylethanolamine-hydrolysing phospholipase D
MKILLKELEIKLTGKNAMFLFPLPLTLPRRICPLGVKELLYKLGVTNCTELDWWSSYHYLDTTTGKTAEITLTPAKHWTARGLFDRNSCLWGSFVVRIGKYRIFFSGDTAYCPVFKMIGDLYGPFDFASIGIGAYSPRWFMKDVHCNPEEAMKIHLDLKSKQSMGIHWGTFPLTEEEPIEPPLELARVRDMNNLSVSSFFATSQGETITFGDTPKYDIATVYNDLYGSYLEQLRNAPPVV